MKNLVPKECEICEEVKKSVDCIVLRAGRRNVPDKIFLIKALHLGDVENDFGGQNCSPLSLLLNITMNKEMTANTVWIDFLKKRPAPTASRTALGCEGSGPDLNYFGN